MVSKYVLTRILIRAYWGNWDANCVFPMPPVPVFAIGPSGRYNTVYSSKSAVGTAKLVLFSSGRLRGSNHFHPHQTVIMSRADAEWKLGGLIRNLLNRIKPMHSVPWLHDSHLMQGYDDGIFIGGRGSGKGLHVDQAGQCCEIFWELNVKRMTMKAKKQILRDIWHSCAI